MPALLSSKHFSSAAVPIFSMSILDELKNADLWRKFYEEKLPKLPVRQVEELFSFIENKEYLPLARKLADGEYPFGLPEKKLVNKMGSTKKRVVYAFNKNESYILKFIARRLGDYDGIFSENLFSFRREFGVKGAVCSVLGERTAGMYCYKADVSDYFNSIDTDILLGDLSAVLNGDLKLLEFFRRLLTEDKATESGKVVSLKRGAMAGTPVSPFFANVYLMSLDAHFSELKIPYARYSDDIILFAKSPEELNVHINYLREFLCSRKLKINADKETFAAPYEKREFLGLAYKNGKFDLSDVTLEKMKGKIRRKARALYRWKLKTGASNDRAVRAFFKRFNRKFYDATDAGELTWSRWFFPVLTSDDGLKQIDDCLLLYARFLTTGRFNKLNFPALPYENAKQLGFTPLVHEFWQYVKTRENK